MTAGGEAVSTALTALDGVSSAVPAWAEPVDGGWVLRLHETLGRRGNLKVGVAAGAKAQPVDLLGQPVAKSAAAADELAVPITAYQVRSVKFVR